VPILDTDEKTFMAWEDWHSLRKLCGYHPRLNISSVISTKHEISQPLSTPAILIISLSHDYTTALEIPHMGAALDVPALINRWTAEPIGFLLIPATSFISNAK
jgi:hypothetical protein